MMEGRPTESLKVPGQDLTTSASAGWTNIKIRVRNPERESHPLNAKTPNWTLAQVGVGPEYLFCTKTKPTDQQHAGRYITR